MLTREQSNAKGQDAIRNADVNALRELCRNDLFFLLTVGCRRRDVDNDWLYERCQEVQASPDGRLDLWAREHYKSTLITFGKSIQDLLVDPDNTTIGIFSHTRPIAKGFVEQIKRELESNSFLKNLFPDILYQDPRNESPKWSLDSGLIVKRKTNPKEASIEAWGLVDGQPTSKHFTVLVYDDVVTRESVTTPEQIKKVTSAWELSLNLGSQGGKKRFIGTRYHANDTYRTVIERGSAIPRIYPATHNGEIDGEPVFMSKELLIEKRRDMGPYTFSTQMLQNPIADKAMSFKEEWLQFYDKVDHSRWNKYLLIDPASEKKKSNDYTVMAVIALAPDNNYYLVDAVRDRLNLTERANKVFYFHREYSPTVGYEKYGMQSDIEHIKYVQEHENYRFPIIALGGSLAKNDRIKALIPIFEQKRFYLPKKLMFVNSEKKSLDFVKLFTENEYTAFPVSTHDDMLDCIARVLDPLLGAKFPKAQRPKPKEKVVITIGSQSTGWMG